MRLSVRLLSAATLLAGCSFSGDATDETPDAAISVDAAQDAPAIDAALDAAGPQTVSFQNNNNYAETHDTMLDSQNPGSMFGDRADIMWEFDGMDDARLGLLRFGLIIGSDPGQVPANSQVLSATLSGVVFNGTDVAANLRRVLVPWDEDTTFTAFAGDGVIDGTEFDDAVAVTGPQVVGAFAIDVTLVVQGWVDDPTSNNGWIFFPQSGDQTQIRSSEELIEALRPKLEVTYMP